MDSRFRGNDIENSIGLSLFLKQPGRQIALTAVRQKNYDRFTLGLLALCHFNGGPESGATGNAH